MFTNTNGLSQVLSYLTPNDTLNLRTASRSLQDNLKEAYEKKMNDSYTKKNDEMIFKLDEDEKIDRVAQSVNQCLTQNTEIQSQWQNLWFLP